MPAPDGVIFEVEFVAGTWTDVSSYVDATAKCVTTFGRSSVFSAVQPSVMTVTLDNTDGRFTPGRQTLVDGTPHPYWPNVMPRKRIRRRLLSGSTRYVRFLGYVKGWPTAFKGTQMPRVTITGEDRLTRLSRVKMLAPIRTEVLADNPAAYWPLTDDGSTMSSVDVTGNQPPLLEVGVGVGTALQWAQSVGPSPDDGPVVRVPAPASGTSYTDPIAGLSNLDRSGPATAMFWFLARTPSPGVQQVLLQLYNHDIFSDSIFVVITAANSLQLSDNTGNILGTYPVTPIDGRWHHVALVWPSSGATVRVYFDGAVLGTVTMSGTLDHIRVIYLSGNNLLGAIGHLSYYTTALSAARIATHNLMGNLRGELVSDRIARYLRYGGLQPSDMSIDPSTVACGTPEQNGKDITSAVQELSADTEGAGSFLFVQPSGQARFTSRASDVPTQPVMTLDAGGDLVGDDYAPTFGDDELLNSIDATQASASGGGPTVTVEDAVSIATFDRFTDSFTSYALDPADVKYNAQDRVARYSDPAFRLDQITVDLYTAQTAGLYDALGQLQLGQRIRVTNLYPAAAPVSQLDLIVQGGTETISDVAYLLTLMTSAADNPAPLIANDAVYGDAQCDTQTLSAALTATASTVRIASAAGSPTFSTAAGDYPMTISVGTEHIQLAGPPGGSGSPQVFTGTTRGVDGTTAAAQAAGASVDLAPLLTAAL